MELNLMMTFKENNFDIIIIGSGPGGGTLAYALKDVNARILMVERGKYLPQEDKNWDSKAVLFERCYRSDDMWQNQSGRYFHPSSYNFVGGQTKVYGSTMLRFREEDFQTIEHREGISPGWPITYNQLEPYYCQAEKIYYVHGKCGDDPTEPYRSRPYPYPPIPHEPAIKVISKDLKKIGLRPFCQPIAVKYGKGGRCTLCKKCVLFPCKIHAKGDTEVCCIRPALESGNVDLWAETSAKKLITDSSGKFIKSVIVERKGKLLKLNTKIVVVSCGAVNTPKLLFDSSSSIYPNGLANSSGLLGKNYMQHNISFLVTVNPFRELHTSFEKTLALNDFYFGDDNFRFPMGHIQLAGKIDINLIAKHSYSPLIQLPKILIEKVSERVLVWSVISEDLPDSNNKIILNHDGKPCIFRKPNNLIAHNKLLTKTKRILASIGLKNIFTYHLGTALSSHYMGTLPFGIDQSDSVLNPNCRAHDINNLYVVDASFFPSSGAVNPVLTIAAQSLRVANHLVTKYHL
jgi:choline dehydrogenase-like flavoprotein